VFEDSIDAAIVHLQQALHEYRSGEFEAAEESVYTALGPIGQARENIRRIILDVHTQAQREKPSAN
jgi:hypothetical protein